MDILPDGIGLSGLATASIAQSETSLKILPATMKHPTDAVCKATRPSELESHWPSNPRCAPSGTVIAARAIFLTRASSTTSRHIKPCGEGRVHGQFAANAQIQTLSRKPATVVPSANPALMKRESRARTFPTWFMVAPQRKRLFTCSRISLVLRCPLVLRKISISLRKRPVRLLVPHLVLYGQDLPRYSS